MIVDNRTFAMLFAPIVLFGAIVFTFFPNKIISLLARDVRRRYMRGSETVDSLREEKLSQDIREDKYIHALIERGVDHPEEFSNLRTRTHKFGLGLWLLFGLFVVSQILILSNNHP